MAAHATSTADHATAAGLHVAHVSASSTLLRVLVALLILTVITVGASRIDFGGANLFIAMLISVVKVTLVVTWFMHLKGDTAVNILFFLSSFVFLSLLFLFTISDWSTRGDTHPTLIMTSPVNPSVYPSSLKHEH